MLLAIKDRRDRQREKEEAKAETQAEKNGNNIEIAFEAIKDRVEAKVKIIQENDKLATAAGDYYSKPKDMLEEL